MKFIRPLSLVKLTDISLVGGKASSLGEMISSLPSINVPPGFVMTTEGYDRYLEYNQIDLQSDIKTQILSGTFPDDLSSEINSSYDKLDKCLVAVRSSATCEDLEGFSFAGQQDTYLNVTGDILPYIQRCMASLFNDRAVSYRKSVGDQKLGVKIAVIVQKMIPSKSSGVAFSLDPDSGFRNVVVINGTFGLGELLVQGEVKPDEFVFFKPTKTILSKTMGQKEEKITALPDGGTIKEHISNQSYSLTDEQVLELSRQVLQIEEYYTHIYGKDTPIDVEWALDDQIYIVQARPETVHSNQTKELTRKEYILNTENRKKILSGIAVGQKIASGNVRVLSSFYNNSFIDGDILVVDQTSPDWEPLMKRAAGIVTNKGGRTCHAAIIAREMGIPAIVGTESGTIILKDQQQITISCAEGLIGQIYEGILPFQIKEYSIHPNNHLKIQLMLNIADPTKAFTYAQYPHRGVGLLRLEFIIAKHVRVHPNALLFPDKVTDPNDRKQIIDLINPHNIHNLSSNEDIIKHGSDYYISKLAEGISIIAAAFYPEEVIVRFSDFKSNEYRLLLGGKYFEPEEENPMIGFRGCSRYYSSSFCQAFQLECQAIRYLHQTLKLTNIAVMLPFCRTVQECQSVLTLMENSGLKRSSTRVFLMCEIPANVILAEQFLSLVDGYSIGSNDLTQLTLGLDRDSSLVSHLFDERNEAVKWMISHVISTAKRLNKKIGICGDAPSSIPEFVEFLASCQIDSISCTADAFFHAHSLLNNLHRTQ